MKRIVVMMVAMALLLMAADARYAHAEDMLSLYQAIPTTGAQDWESFNIDGQTYLAVANQRDDAGNYTVDSKIYRCNGSGFEEVQAITTSWARDLESFVIQGTTYLAVGSWNDVWESPLNDSKIYKWNAISQQF